MFVIATSVSLIDEESGDIRTYQKEVEGSGFEG